MILPIIKSFEPLILNLWRFINRSMPFFVRNPLWIKNHVLREDEEHSSVLFCFFMFWFISIWKFLSFYVFHLFWYVLSLFSFLQFVSGLTRSGQPNKDVFVCLHMAKSLKNIYKKIMLFSIFKQKQKYMCVFWHVF